MTLANKTIIPIIIGPTAIGKTHLAIQLALKTNGEIISADSMQIYKKMNIGTAKPSTDEKQEIPHHLIDLILPDQRFTVADFQEQALTKIDELTIQKTLPIIAGGTGLYIHSLLYDMDFSKKEVDQSLRNKLEAIYKEKGSEELFLRLKSINSEVALRIHPNNWKRIIRAIEVSTYSSQGIKDFSKDLVARKNYCFKVFGLYQDRNTLYNSINNRVDDMLKNGLEEEVRELLRCGYNRNSPALKGVGYKELIAYFYGECSYEDAVGLIKRNTRRFAKRQMTWFNRIPDVTWYSLNGSSSNDKEKELEVINNLIIKELKGVGCSEK
ncbi:tRNA (adenosine(37)-N6)-dimethylallyltransferase MiaA [Tindallia californiensis]|uniref:tRNA dimethylallyltransferase n=1 Tax=Tindallia californiensis TaxID=159292 RepID=A0A1H3NM19_9FIRM|nr:tRNA (adenosine(37)-N6)-dimethylallyltransferase MiaA [Tindallia californiensis]SDY89710.1 tRNA dimethylallyltransferase [Tindallia californiensis]